MNVLALFVLLTAAHSNPPGPVPERIIRGDWCAGSKNAFHEEFSLDIEEGVRVFSSWLHQRPALHGTWGLKGRTLTIRGVNGDVMEYTIISATRTRLVMREQGRKDREVYVRIGRCLPFENPYKPDA